MEDIEIMYLVAVFIGTSFIAITPFIRKYLRGEIEGWNHRYTVLILVSYVVALIVSVMIYALNPIELSDPIATIAAGFTVGLASKPLVEEIIKHVAPDWFNNG